VFGLDPLLDLTRSAIAGDPGAMRRLVDAVAPAVYNVARAVLGVSNADAQDAAQESLVAFVEALERFRGESGVQHFACRVALHVSVSARRRARSRRSTADAFGGDALALQPATGRSEEELSAARRRNVLRSLIDTLPEEQAETIGLRFMLGCSLREVAEVTGVPENTVRSRLRLAKEALRRRIEEDPAAAALLRDVG
jgi:RNA polymerase sigma factor (sigma-70 family)